MGIIVPVDMKPALSHLKSSRKVKQCKEKKNKDKKNHKKVGMAYKVQYIVARAAITNRLKAVRKWEQKKEFSGEKR